MLLLKDALIVDGLNTPRSHGDLLIQDERIVAVGSLVAPCEATVVDLAGRVLAPGFIDLHSHSDAKLLDGNPVKTLQGVTTEVVGNCGFSIFPNCGAEGAVGAYNDGILCDVRTFARAADFLAACNQHSRNAHVESLVGHGTLRTAALALKPHLHGAALSEFLCDLLEEALLEGAAGFSSGLMYAPGATAPTEELEALCSVVARHNKLYATHMRSYSWTLEEAVEEQLHLARKTGCRLQISHLQAAGQLNWHRQQHALDAIESAFAKGIDVAFDCYPYLAGSTVLSQLLPQEIWVEGFESFTTRIASDAARNEVSRWIENNTAQRWADIFISAHAPLESGQSLLQTTIAQFAEQEAVEPGEAVLRLIERTRGDINIVAFNQSEENLRQLITHPLSSIISDGLFSRGIPHPRLYGSFVSLLGYYVHQCGWLSLEEAVHKITAAPAARIQLVDRGRLAKGCVADLVCFDPEHVSSPANYANPRALPFGIHSVYRNGKEILASVQPAG